MDASRRKDQKEGVARRRASSGGEETGLTTEVGELLAIFDRPDKDTLALFFAATVNDEAAAWAAPMKPKEIAVQAFVHVLPEKTTLSAKHFWDLRSA